jgi:hypothetical protein
MGWILQGLISATCSASKAEGLWLVQACASCRGRVVGSDSYSLVRIGRRTTDLAMIPATQI